MATFFDIKKAYDSVWHSRLLYKLKQIGVSGQMYEFIKCFLSKRSICTRIGTCYSSFRDINIGIPQGSIIAPLLFSVLLHDLPKVPSKNIHLVQYADDIAIWMNTNIRKQTNRRVITHVQKLYQVELDKLDKYMKENGLELSGEKTQLMLFSNGENPKFLPQLVLGFSTLSYSSNVKFLGMYLSPKLNWRFYIEHIINKARQRLNFLKVISAQYWGQDTRTLLHLATSLVRSKLTYGQEVYFSAPQTLLRKLQSIDSKAIKLALGVPVHTDTLKTYREASLLSLDDQRKLSAAKYITRCLSVSNSVTNDIFLDSDIDYPKRAKTISYLQPIKNYTDEMFKSCDIEISSISKSPVIPIIPHWEHIAAKFDTQYTSLIKKMIMSI